MASTNPGGTNSSFVPLPGSKRELLSNSRAAGPIDSSEVSTLIIRTRARNNIADLENTVRDLYRQPLTKRKYLSREELAQKFGANPEDLDEIEHYAQQHNLVIGERSAAERKLVLEGKLKDLLNAFHADVHMFHHSSGTYRGRRGEILIPDRFKDKITAIMGFDTRPMRRSSHRLRRSSKAGPGGRNGVASTAFAKRYNFPAKSASGKSLDGTGQCIGIIELGGGFQNSDLQIYFQEIGVPLPKVSAIAVGHGANRPNPNDGADGEVMLDIEVAGAVVPAAAIAVYFAPNQGAGFHNGISAAIHDAERNPSVISISWGGPEDGMTQQAIKSYHELFVSAAALGITICVASGDHGTADLDATHWDQKIHVDHPSCDNLVLSCGGTQIEKNVDVVWNDGTPFDASVEGGGGWTSGGGISMAFPVPDYQQNSNLPVSIDTGKPGRGVPDIAMSATNYFLRVDGGEGADGGTSAVAPLMAGLVARLNQARGRVGFLNPFLYANVSKGVVKDVIKGSNSILHTAKGYDAKPGWDACTGLGTPDGTKILQNI